MGNPLMSNRMMLRDARKLMVLVTRKEVCASGLLSAIMDNPEVCGVSELGAGAGLPSGSYFELSPHTSPGGLTPAWKAMVAISDATTINADCCLSNQSSFFLLNSLQFFPIGHGTLF